MRELNNNYDSENDVVYVNFYWPPKEATGSVKSGDCILRYNGTEIIGITIVNFRGSNRRTTK